MSFETLKTEIQDQTLIITINRPKVYNALNASVIRELGEAVEEVYNNSAIKGAIITGEGPKAFAAGADISELSQVSAEEAKVLGKRGQTVFDKIERSPKPIVAAVNGFALGGGCELAMSCHFRLASENASFGQPEVNLGLIPGYGGTQRLPRLIGLGKANYYLLTGDSIKAAAALEMGLVNQVVALDELLPVTQNILQKIYSKGPLAVALTLQSVYHGIYDPADGYEEEARNFATSLVSEDGREGTAAFLEKRKAEFSGK